MTPPQTPIKHDGLYIKQLSFGYYAETPIINQFSLDIPKGGVHCVLGTSGSGKTTLLRLIAGLEKITSGAIWISKKEIANFKTHVPPENRSVGMVFQDYGLFPNRNVIQNVTFGINTGSKQDQLDKATDLLNRVGIFHLANRMPNTLSGGQQQRVAIARSLAHNPSVMLLDEPFSSLDSQTRQDVRTETISILRSENISTLMVTHDPAEAEIVGDKISWLKR